MGSCSFNMISFFFQPMRTKKKKKDEKAEGPSSLFIFGESNFIRRFVMFLMEWPPFEYTILGNVHQGAIFLEFYWATVSYSSSPDSRFFDFLLWLQLFFWSTSSKRWNENRIALVKMPAVILPVTIIANCVVLAVETPLPNGDKTQLARDLVRHISSTCTCLEKLVASGLCSSMSDVSWRDMVCLRVKRGNKFAWETFFYPRHCALTSWLWSKMALDFRHHSPWAQ